jgi:ubiquinone/menaquinone biosynthesis C-methylase UbiE
MLDMARRRLVQVDLALLEQAEFCCCPVEQVGERFPAGHFGAVLAHTLLEYVPEPWKVLSGLICVLACDGILSLLVVNPHAEPFRLAWAKRNPTKARDALATMSSQADLFGVPRRVLPLEQVREAMQASSVQLLAERGVRIFSDYADPEDIAEPQYFEALKDLELAAGGLEPYRRVGRYTHILGVKTG